MLKKLIIGLCLIHSICIAQYNEIIRTGRPGQSIGPFTVGKNILQFQQGVEYNAMFQQPTNPNNIITNNVIRYGLTEDMEISTLIDYQSFNYTVSDTTYRINALSAFHLGFRVNFNSQKGIIPSTGFQMRLKLPDVSKNFGSNFISPVMVFIANWNLPHGLGLGTNWILTGNGNDPVPIGKYIINFSFPIYKKLSGFVENYGQLKSDIFETRYDGGFAYVLNKNVQLDVSGGYGNNVYVEDYFISGGISWRLNFRKEKVNLTKQ